MLTLYGVGKALKIITKDYQIFNSGSARFLCYIMLLGIPATLIALFNLTYETNIIDAKLYIIILLSGIEVHLMDGYISTLIEKNIAYYD